MAGSSNGGAKKATAKTPSMKVKKGDTVVVLAGKDKGAKGRVIAAYPKLQKVLVEGVGRVHLGIGQPVHRSGPAVGTEIWE